MTRTRPGTGSAAPFDYTFRDAALRERALTPPSAGLPDHNQRLEFLGDAVLHACAALLVYRTHPDWDEGALTKLRGHLVCTDSLSLWAADLGLRLNTGPRSPESGLAGAARRKALADAMEALLAAVFLDAGGPRGGLEAVYPLVEARHGAAVRAANPTDWQARDFKTALQERAAALGWPPPTYELLEKAGPEHAPRFTMTVAVGPHQGRATAGTRKGAEALAAREVLQALGTES